MNVSSFLGIQTALRGLTAHQRALDVTAHNVANASTEGYSRQEAVLAATQALELGAGQLQRGGGLHIGQGVDVQAFRRVRDDFADLQVRAQGQSLARHETLASHLGRVEQAFNEPSNNGLSAVLGQFWSAWDDVANHPEDPASRQALVNQAAILVDRVSALRSDIAQVGTDAATQYTRLTQAGGQVSQLATEVAQLNAAIKSAVGTGSQPNDLLDRRDLALDKLSRLAQVSVTGLGTGAVRVTFGDAATPLVDDGVVTWPQALTAPGGQLGGLLEVGGPSGRVAGYLAALDGFASNLIGSVNTVHGTGFFSGTNAATIAVAVTAATVRASGLPGPPAGANEIALSIAGLRGTTGGPDPLYAQLVARVGGEARDAGQQTATAGALLKSAAERRTSVSGVSMDEEMASMLRFQRGYQASARAMTTMDEMLETLISRTGRVGL